MFARFIAKLFGTSSTPIRNASFRPALDGCPTIPALGAPPSAMATLRVMPSFQELEDRATPANLHWTGMATSGGVPDPDAGKPLNWLEVVRPVPGDNLYFGTETSAGANYDFDLGMILASPGLGSEEGGGGTGQPGWLNGIHIVNEYAGTVTMLIRQDVAVFEMTSAYATLDQQNANCDLRVTQYLDRRGGTFNSADRPKSLLTLDGGTGTIAPVGEGTVSLGSNLSVVNSALLTMAAGTVACVNPGLEFAVNTQGGIKTIPGVGKTVRVTDPGGAFTNQPSVALIQGGGYVEVVSGEGIFEGMCQVLGGRLTLREETTLWLALSPRVPASGFTMYGGLTELYTGSTLISDNEAHMQGGLLTTRVGLPSTPTGGPITSDATIRTSKFVVTGGDIVLGADPVTFCGTLTCTGDVDWRGGTYHPHLIDDGSGNGGPSDVWRARGTFTIRGSAALAPMSLDVARNPIMPTSGMRWLILVGRPIDGPANASYNQGIWLHETEFDPPTHYYIKGI